MITTADAFLDGLPSKRKLWESRIEIEAGLSLIFRNCRKSWSILGMSGKARSRDRTVCSQRRDLGCLSADRRDSGQDRTVGG